MTARPRVLVVEDDAPLRMLCSLNLAAEGLEVIEAEDGRRGLEFALADPPDLVLTDVRTPGLDGFELAARLRSDERTRAVPLLFLSAETAAANPARAHALGALAYLTKPFDPVALAALIAETLTGGGALPASLILSDPTGREHDHENHALGRARRRPRRPDQRRARGRRAVRRLECSLE